MRKLQILSTRINFSNYKRSFALSLFYLLFGFSSLFAFEIQCPVIPGFYNNDASSCGANLSIPNPTTDDPLWLDYISNDYNGGASASGFYPIGTTRVTFTVYFTDATFKQCFVDVVVVDSERPIVSCPNPPSPDCPEELFIYPNLTSFIAAGGSIVDNCGFEQSSFKAEQTIVPLAGCGEDVTWTISIEDYEGNLASCSMNFVMNDTEDPVLSDPPVFNDISCGDNYPPENPEWVTATDNCTASPNIQVRVSPRVQAICAVTPITYTWIATDDCGNSSSVSTTFFVNPSSTLPRIITSPLPLGDINCDDPFPQFQNVETEHCNPVEVETEAIFVVDVCAGYPVTYRWTPVDLCGTPGDPVEMMFNVLPDTQAPQMNLPNQLNDIACNATQHPQEELLAFDLCKIDDAAPLIMGNCDPIVGCIEDPLLTVGFVYLAQRASDDCTSDDNISYTYEVDLDSDGNPNSSGSGMGAEVDLSGNFPMGMHTINYTFTDLAGNMTPCSQTFEVMNCISPIARCNKNLSFSLDYVDTNGDGINDDYLAIIDIADIDGGSYDPSGNPVVVSFSPDPSDDEIVFDCPNRGVQTIELWVTATNGSQSVCEANVIILDSQNQCGSIPTSNQINGNNFACGGPCDVVKTIDPFVEDVCAGYTITQRWTATDDCGNITEETMSYNVLPSSPVIIPPADAEYVVEDNEICELEVEIAPAMEDLNLCSPIASITTDYGAGNLPTNGGTVTLDLGVHTITYTATDDCGNTYAATSTIGIYRPCNIACREQVNISLGSECKTIITASMVGTDVDVLCEFYYEVELFDDKGNQLPNDEVYAHHRGQLITVKIIEPYCGNSCWGYALIEDKFPPQIECITDPIIVSCNDLSNIPEPTVNDNCDYWQLVLTDEREVPLHCDADFTKKIIRTYVAEDIYSGVRSDACSQEIYLERLDYTDIVYPNDTVLLCDADFELDDFGNPSPSVVGVPTFEGIDVFPSDPQFLCNAIVDYSDNILIDKNCHKKIVRTWQLSEWHCLQDELFTGVQLIKIEDATGPVFTCPDTLVFTTKYGCVGEGTVPPISAKDNCGDVTEYRISYPGGGVLEANGGLITGLEKDTSEITYYVYDECGNGSSCNTVIVVKDNTPPVPICEQFKVISLPNDGWVEVIAEVFDLASWDDCHIDKFEVRRPNDPLCSELDTIWRDKVSFCCDDVGRDDLKVELKVTDYHGNYNFCWANVEIQDKVIPEIYCPEDVTIYCDDPYDLDQLGIDFGNASNSLNCSSIDIDEQVEDDLEQCGTGTITRTFSFEHNGINMSCSQTITLIPHFEYDYSSIVWPESFKTDAVCDTSGLSPDQLSAPYNFPVFPPAECHLLGHQYEDQYFFTGLETEECAKIIRTWTVINWCDRLPDGDFNRFTYEQTIVTSNSMPPELTGGCQDQEFCFENPDCQPEPILFLNNAFDDCTAFDQLRWVISIDFFKDGIIDTISDHPLVNITYPFGEHKITWEVYDNCNNKDICEHDVKVTNCKAPTPVCINGLAIELVPMDLTGNDGIPDAEMAEVWASDFDASSIGACGNPFTLSFSSDTTNKRMLFDCDDLGNVQIQMWITDVISGAQDFCETFIDVQDNNSVDICPSQVILPSGNITGKFYTEDNRYIDEVEVMLMGDDDDMFMTDEDGSYLFEDKPFGDSYTVAPLKDFDDLNGVSTLDLVLIQRHILGLNILDSPYKIIAADVNKDNDVSGIDLLELRKLILGIYDELPDNTSWRFVSQDYAFVDPLNPWYNLPENYDIFDFNTNMEVDFVGMKVGDVNGTVELGLLSGVDSRNEESLALFIEPLTMEYGTSRMVEIAAQEIIKLDGFQLTLKFDHAFVDIEFIEGGQLDLDASNYHISEISPGTITISWNAKNGQKFDIAAGDVLLNLALIAKQSFENLDLFTIANDPTKAEMYASGIKYIPELQLSDTPLSAKVNSVVLFQNKPNPWSNETNIGFYIPEDGDVKISLYDHSGRLLTNQTRYFDAGRNEVIIDKSEINTSGVVVYELVYKNQVISKRMLVLD